MAGMTVGMGSGTILGSSLGMTCGTIPGIMAIMGTTDTAGAAIMAGTHRGAMAGIIPTIPGVATMHTMVVAAVALWARFITGMSPAAATMGLSPAQTIPITAARSAVLTLPTIMEAGMADLLLPSETPMVHSEATVPLDLLTTATVLSPVPSSTLQTGLSSVLAEAIP